MEKKLTASERIKTVITHFIFKDNYWGYLFSKINRRENLNLPAMMGVEIEQDGTITLVYNTNYVNLADDEFLKFAIEHEGIHILNHHIPRLLKILVNEPDEKLKIQKRDIWNKAADCATNTLLKGKDKYVLTDGTEYELYYPKLFDLPDRKISEFYYYEFLKMKKRNSDGSSGNLVGDHSGWNLTGKNQVSDLGSLSSRIQEYSNSLLQESYSNVKNKGNIPGNIYESISNLLKPPQIPYYQLIEKLVKGSRLSKYKRAYTRINKKRVYTFFIDKKNLPMISPFPGKTKNYTFNISILLDTSGSMRIEDIYEGLSGVKNIIENDKDCKTTVIECDAQIQKEYVVKKLSDIDYKICGRGGTVLFPGLQRAKDLKTDVTLVFTDGYCDNINGIDRRLLPKKIIYVLTKYGDSRCVDSTGYIVRMEK